MYNVGDKVRVREWDDMESEYGSFEVGNRVILHTLCLQFDKTMHMCGRSYHVSEVIHNPLFDDNLYILSNSGYTEDYMIPEKALISCKEEQNDGN